MHGFFVHESFVKPSVLAHIESLVAGVDHQGVVRQAFFVQIVQYASYVVIQGFYHLGIVAHVALIFPFRQFFSLRLGFIEFLDKWRIKGIVLCPFFVGHTAYEL